MGEIVTNSDYFSGGLETAASGEPEPTLIEKITAAGEAGLVVDLGIADDFGAIKLELEKRLEQLGDQRKHVKSSLGGFSDTTGGTLVVFKLRKPTDKSTMRPFDRSSS